MSRKQKTAKQAPRLSLAVQYASAAQGLPSRPRLRRWVSAALAQDAQITLRIVNKAEGQELNRSYRGKDYPTNVLTFVYDEAPPRHGGVEPAGAGGAAGRLLPQAAGFASNVSQPPPRHGGVEPAGAGGAAGRLLPQAAGFASNVSQPPPLLGDIVLCAPVVAREAREQRKELAAHYAHLVIHGVLHLQGYDHEKKRDAAEMESLETAIMAKLGYADPYAVTD